MTKTNVEALNLYLERWAREASRESPDYDPVVAASSLECLYNISPIRNL